MPNYGATLTVTFEADSDEAATTLIETVLKSIDSVPGVVDSDLDGGPEELMTPDDDDDDED